MAGEPKIRRFKKLTHPQRSFVAWVDVGIDPYERAAGIDPYERAAGIDPYERAVGIDPCAMLSVFLYRWRQRFAPTRSDNAKSRPNGAGDEARLASGFRVSKLPRKP